MRVLTSRCEVIFGIKKILCLGLAKGPWKLFYILPFSSSCIANVCYKCGQTRVFFPLYLETSEDVRNFCVLTPLGHDAVQLTYAHCSKTAVAERLSIQIFCLELRR